MEQERQVKMGLSELGKPLELRAVVKVEAHEVQAIVMEHLKAKYGLEPKDLAVVHAGDYDSNVFDGMTFTIPVKPVEEKRP